MSGACDDDRIEIPKTADELEESIRGYKLLVSPRRGPAA